MNPLNPLANLSSTLRAGMMAKARPVPYWVLFSALASGRYRPAPRSIIIGEIPGQPIPSFRQVFLPRMSNAERYK